MRNLITSAIANLLCFAAVFLTIEPHRALAALILALGTCLVFNFGKLEGAQNMLDYMIKNQEKEYNGRR